MPDITAEDNLNEPTPNLKRFMELGSIASRFINHKSTTVVLTRIHFENNKIYATNGHYAFIAECVMPPEFNNINISTAFFKEHLKKDCYKLEITADKKHLIMDGVESPYILIEEQYPNMELVIPKKHIYSAEFSKSQLEQIVKQTISECIDKDKVLLIAATDDSFPAIKISAKHFNKIDEDSKAISHPIPYSGTCGESPFFINGTFLLTILKSLTGLMVKIQYSTLHGALMVFGVDKEVQTIIMPIKNNN